MLIRGSLLIAVLALLTLGAETAVRFYDPQQLGAELVTAHDGIVTLRPSFATRIVRGDEYVVTTHSNDLRVRGTRDYGPRPAAGMRRIVALGDEVTFGIGVGDEYAWPTSLEGVLNRHAAGVEVLNAGVPGTSTGNQALWFEKGLADLESKLVILAIHGNDLAEEASAPRFRLNEDGVAEPLPPAELPAIARQNGGFEGLGARLPFWDWLTEHSHLANRVRQVRARPPEPVEDADAAIDLLIGEIRWLRERVTERGAELAVGYLPEQSFFDREFRGSARARNAEALLARLETERAERDLRYEDLTPYLKRWMGRTGRSAWFDTVELYTPLAHYELAKAVARRLAKEVKK